MITRVYAGANHITNNQWTAFSHEWRRLKLDKITKLEVLTHQRVKELGFKQNDIFTWLLDSNVHFILCHMHQGQKLEGPWNCSQYIQNLRKFDYHLGYPMIENLGCPIFTQNKIIYIFALADRTNYTLAISMKNIESLNVNEPSWI